MPYISYDSGYREEYEIRLDGDFTIQELEYILAKAKKDKEDKSILLEGYYKPEQLRKIADELEKAGD